jgi:ParB family chromosome partitioning protein
MIACAEIPAIVHEMDDERVAAVSLIENLQRKDLNYFEEASAYARLLHEFGMTQEELGRRWAKASRP